MATTFGFYGLIKGRISHNPIISVATETTLIAPIALLYIFYIRLQYQGSGFSFGYSISELALLIASGLLTALPLVLFSNAVQSLRYSTVGLINYVNPTLQFLIAVFIFRLMDLPLAGVAPKAKIKHEISLDFVERNRFDVTVLDKYGKVIAESTDGTNGFLGVVFNAIKRERIKKRVVGDNVLRMVKYENGRIAVIDDWTGMEIQINSFGIKNLEVFGFLFDNK